MCLRVVFLRIMLCEVCNSTQFFLHDGTYFCSECKSQAQETRDEQSEGEILSQRSLLSSPSVKKQIKDKRKFYAPWITAEGYNAILYHQVRALIALGASDHLKNVVLHMWSRYLQKGEVAFRCDFKAKEDKPRLGPLYKRRDMKLLYGNKVCGAKRKTFKGRRVKRKASSKAKEKALKEHDTNVSVQNNLSGAENKDTGSEDYSPFSDTTGESSGAELSDVLSGITSEEDSEVEHKDKKKNMFSTCATKFKNKYGKKPATYRSALQRYVSEMCLTKTLCFCYLGLLYTGDHLNLTDLLRLVNEGKIPYINASSCFPPAMAKLQCADHLYFNTLYTPVASKISHVSAQLFSFLKLPSFRHPLLMPIVIRYVKDLNLPYDIISITKILVDKFNVGKCELYSTNCKQKNLVSPLPFYDGQAMAFLLVAMKLIFVLDGSFEQEHSIAMLKANSILKEKKVFVWLQWQRQMSLKQFLFLKKNPTHSEITKMDSLSADSIISNYPFTHLKSAEDFSKKSMSVFVAARHEIKKMLASNFNIPQKSPRPFSLLPLTQQVKDLQDNWRNFQAYKETKDIDFSFISEDFSSHRLFHSYSDSSDQDEIISILLSSLYEDAEILILQNALSRYERITRSTSKYWTKTFGTKHYDSSSMEWADELPRSFRWLLDVFSQYLGVSFGALYKEFADVEKQLIN